MITINGKKYNSGYTHAGVFHADEVSATALLQILDPTFQVIRGFNPPENENILVFDIGDGEFDHHKSPREMRDGTDVPYSAVGKIWRAISDQFNLTEEQQLQFDESIIKQIDAQDNLGPEKAGNPFSKLIAPLNPTWDSKISSDKLFEKAVDIVKTLFTAWFERAYADNRAPLAVEEACNNDYDGLAISDYYVPSNLFSEKDVYFSICPSQRGGWQSVSIKREDQIFFAYGNVPKEKLPKGWLFCHASGFLASFETKEDAIKFSLEAIENH